MLSAFHHRTLLLCVLSALCVSSLPATTLLVDGPGDGDGDGTDDFDSVHDALIGFGPLGTDGASDEILITVPVIIEPFELTLNGTAVTAEQFTGGPFPPLTDPMRIAGASAVSDEGRVVVEIPPNLARYDDDVGIDVRLADGQSLDLANLALIPGGSVGSSFLVIEEVEPVTRPKRLTMRNVFLVSRLGPGVPADPREGEIGAGIFNPDSDPFVLVATISTGEVTVENFVMGGHSAGAGGIGLLEGPMTLENIQILEMGTPTLASLFGFRAYRGQLTVRNLVTNAFAVVASSPGQTASDEAIGLDIGGVVRLEGSAGMIIGNPDSGAGGSVRMRGTEEDPLLFSTSAGPGLTMHLSDGASVELSHAIFDECTQFGIDLDLDFDGDLRVALSDVLVANTQERFFSFGMRILPDEASGEKVITIRDSTFHRIDSDLAGERHIAFGADGPNSTSVSLEITNCIFSGEEPEVGLSIDRRSEAQIHVTDSAFALEGPHALGQAIQGTPVEPVVFENVHFDDPQYVSTDPTDPQAFDIQQPLWATAGPASGPITGWGVYVADLSGIEGVSFH